MSSVFFVLFSLLASNRSILLCFFVPSRDRRCDTVTSFRSTPRASERHVDSVLVPMRLAPNWRTSGPKRDLDSRTNDLCRLPPTLPVIPPLTRPCGRGKRVTVTSPDATDNEEDRPDEDPREQLPHAPLCCQHVRAAFLPDRTDEILHPTKKGGTRCGAWWGGRVVVSIGAVSMHHGKCAECLLLVF